MFFYTRRKLKNQEIFFEIFRVVFLRMWENLNQKIE